MDEAPQLRMVNCAAIVRSFSAQEHVQDTLTIHADHCDTCQEIMHAGFAG
jgi:hypothetical protein